MESVSDGSLTVSNGAAAPDAVARRSGHTGGYRPDIDGVRAVAVLLVIGFHAFPSWVPGGFIGVDLFFVISGYLITGTILRDVSDNKFTYIQFYARRFRRIAPALVVVLLGTFILGTYLLLPAELQALAEHVWAGAVFVTNILLWRQAGYFDAAAVTKPLLHLWSLGVEEQFYLLWPPLLLLARRRGFNTVVTFVIALASFALNVALIAHHATATFYLMPTRLWELLVGALLVQLEVSLGTARGAGGVIQSLLGAHTAPAVRNLKAWMGLVCVLIATRMLHDGDAFPGWWALLPVGAGFLLISAGPEAWLNRVALSSRPAVVIGLFSYPLYLWHWPLLSLSHIAESGPPSRAIRIVCVLLALILAWLTWRVVERPVRRWFDFAVLPRSMRACVALSVAALVSIAIAGAIVQASSGFPGMFARRFPGQAGQLADISVQLEDLAATPFPQKMFPRCSGVLEPGNVLDWCNVAVPGRPIEVAVFGDSHAIYEFPGFADAFTKRGMNSLVIGSSACAPILGVRSFLKGTREKCSAANQLAVDVLKRDAEIRTVVLSALGPYYFSGTSFDVDHRGVSDAANWVLEPLQGSGLTSKEALFEAGYSATIATLESAGKQVAFFVDVPELNFQPASCVPRPIRITKPMDQDACGLPRSTVMKRQAAYRALISRLAVAHPRMRVFDPLPYLCDSVLCSAMHAGRLVYRDSNHLTMYGGQYLGQPLADWLRSAFPPL
jgi:peptidoglycan/LPS O-acetylase OafA/YrhL